MAHSPSFRPDPFHSRQERSAPADVEPNAGSETDLGAWLTEWQSALAANGAGPLSADLALDLVLNKIVDLARESTHATAAAIALMREGEIICRAASGESAPDLGTRLSGDAGLSAACVQTGNWQRCDESESDPRVDSELCRRLGVRSMLVVPVLKKGLCLGVLEVFSGQPFAFGEPELQTLKMLARSIVENVELAAKLPPTVNGSPSGEPGRLSEGNSLAASESREHKRAKSPEVQTADFWTGVLMMAVVALALTLGWMVGRAGWQRDGRGSSAGGRVQSSPNQVAAASAVKPQAPGGELVVYQNGRVVFPQPSQPTRLFAETKPSAKGIQPANSKSELAPGPVRLSPEVTAQLVTRRVEPEYPDAARERRVQGAVDLDALVSKDGVVEKFTAIRGDPDLAAAAAAAVRQWRFRSYRLNGQPEAFQTRITVMFRLP